MEMGGFMSNEEKLIKFYGEFVQLSQDDLFSSTIFFQTVVTAMVFGYEFGEKKLTQSGIYEYILLENIPYNRFEKKKDDSQDFISGEEYLKPFSLIDSDYYINLIMTYFSDPFYRNLLFCIDKLALDLEKNMENLGTFILKQKGTDFYNFSQVIKKLKNIKRTGWLKKERDVPEKYQENDVIHTMQMFALASAYFRIHKPANLNFKKVLEMILIHEVGELLAGDIAEGDKAHDSKRAIEERGIREVFGSLKCGQYFIDLWLDFEDKKSNEAEFVYQLDKLDPILKAKFIDEEMKRDKLFDEFYSFEEKRGTFTTGYLKGIFQTLKKK